MGDRHGNIVHTKIDWAIKSQQPTTVDENILRIKIILIVSE